MEATTKRLWAEQNRHGGDRWRLFRAIESAIEASTVLYPGSYVDIAPSFVFPSVTYIDSDKRTPGFFTDVDGLREIIAMHAGAPPDPVFRFVHGDYTHDLDLPQQGFDLLVSLYAGFVSEHCTDYLKLGGTLLVNSSHGDAAMASIDPRYQLAGAVESRSGGYRVRTDDLDEYLVPRSTIEINSAMLHKRGKGVAYTRSAFAYLFARVA